MASNYPTYKLGEIAKIYNGNSINAEEKEKKYKGVDGRNYIGTKDIEFDCSVNYSNGVRIPFDEKKFKVAPAGSVLVCAEGGSAGKKSAFITEDVCFGNKLFAITNNQGLFDGKYVFYYTRYKRFFDLFKNELSGLIGGVSSKKFGEIPIPLPPLPTQHAIVARIEFLFAELDKGVEKLKTAQQQLKVYRQAVLNDCLTKGSEKWKKVKLGEVAEKIFDGPFGTHLKSDDYVSSGIRVVRLENIKAGYFDDSKQSYVTPEKYEIIKRHTVYPTDLIMSTFISEEVKVCQMPDHIVFAVNKADCIGIRLKKASAINDFIKYYLSLRSVYHQLEIQVHGATRPRVNTTQIKNIEINLPPLPTQQRIVQEIETRLSQAELVEASIEQSLQQAEALRQSILKKAFSGELV